MGERCERADGDVGCGVSWSWSGAHEAESRADQTHDEGQAEIERGERGERGT